MNWSCHVPSPLAGSDGGVNGYESIMLEENKGGAAWFGYCPDESETEQ
jgi:hypothetical protein